MEDQVDCSHMAALNLNELNIYLDTSKVIVFLPLCADCLELFKLFQIFVRYDILADETKCACVN